MSFLLFGGNNPQVGKNDTIIQQFSQRKSQIFGYISEYLASGDVSPLFCKVSIQKNGWKPRNREIDLHRVGPNSLSVTLKLCFDPFCLYICFGLKANRHQAGRSRKRCHSALDRALCHDPSMLSGN